MMLIIYMCLATATSCDKDNAIRVYNLPLPQMNSNCGLVAQVYAVENAVDLEGMQMKVACRLGGAN